FFRSDGFQRLSHFAANGAATDHGHAFSRAQYFSFANFHAPERLLPLGILTAAPRIPDGNGSFQTGLGRKQNIAKRYFIPGRINHQIRNATKRGNVKNTVVGWPVLAYDSCAVKAKYNGDFLERHIVNDLVVSALHESRIQMAEYRFSGS